MADRVLSLTQLLARLGARLITPTDDGRLPCPTCGAATDPAVTTGGPALCLPCTQAELPGTVLDNSVRIEQRMTWNQYNARVEMHGNVWQNPKAWATPRSRLKG